jgi:Werner syndrome ATP-dependent helicase
MREKLNDLLNKYFGHSELKDEQYKIIKNILNGNDVCAVLPTGFGKSVCYQLPFLYTKKCVIVFSPLISLIEDQINQLHKMKIPACTLDSNNKNKTSTLEDIYKGNNKIIFVTPEYVALNNNFLKSLYKNDQISLIAVDESHCVSNWGNDFRPSYKKLSCLRDNIKNIPILALTATATEKIQNDICNILNLDEPVFVTSSFDRPNLYISISERNLNTFDVKIRSLLKLYKGKKILMYCKSRNDCDKYAKKIKLLGYKCDSYHALKNNRTEIQNSFTNGELDCIVATIAFGLGINIPDIRMVIHFNCPTDLESYYQEIGRAGRDGKKSECYLFYSSKDFLVSKRFIDSITNDKFRKYKENELKIIQNFVVINQCRRIILLNHFDKNYEHVECNKCDYCCKPIEDKEDYSKEAKIFFKVLIKLNKGFGIGTIVKVIRGSRCKQVLRIQYLVEDFIGKGKSYSEQWWKSFANQLRANEYIEETKSESTSKFAGNVLKITSKGRDWYRNRNEETMMLQINSKKKNDFIKITFKNFYNEYIEKLESNKIDKLNDIINNIKLIDS